MEKIVKCFRAKVRSLDEDKFTAEVVVTDESLDRYEERVLAEAMKKAKGKFMEHPVLLSSHAYRGLMNQIGQFLGLKVDKETKETIATPKWFVGEGNPEADWGWKLAQKGIAAFSIGFIPKKWSNYEDEEERKKNGGSWRDYEEIELLEISQVLVPANPAALQKGIMDDGRDPVERAVFKDALEFVKTVDKSVEESLEAAENRGWEETENEIRHRVKDPEMFEKFRYMNLKKDKPRVKAVYGKYKEKDEWAIQSLRFPKEDGWTMAEAKKWVKEHPDVSKFFEEVMGDMFTLMEKMAGQVEEIAGQVKALAAKVPDPVELEAVTGQLSISMPALDSEEFKKFLEENKEAIAKMLGTEKQEPAIDIVIDNMSEEKLLEMEAALRKKMSKEEPISQESIISLFSEMNEDIAKHFSAQPPGNGQGEGTAE